MKYLKFERFIWLLLVISVATWGVIIFIVGTRVSDIWKVLTHLPMVVTVDIVCWSLFKAWGWKLRIFRNWLVPFPCLQGTWKGKIQSTWLEPGTRHLPELIPVILVIKQSFVSISCVMYSEEMTSKSYSAEFLVDSEADSVRLCYSYTSTPRTPVREKSVVHKGTALLDILSDDQREFRGEYWTNRQTTGEISLKFMSKRLLQGFPDNLTKKGQGPSSPKQAGSTQ